MHDLRFAFRQLTKSPGFTFIAVLTLALGIGVNAAVFAFIRDMLLHPLSLETRQNLVSLYTARVGSDQDFRSFRYAEFTALRDQSDVFSDVTAFNHRMAAVGRNDELKRSLISFVPENFFATFGLQPLVGRFFSVEESRPGAGLSVVVANHSFWQRLGGRADFVGSQIRINQHQFTVVGIAPQGFGGLHASVGPDVWLPLGALQQLYGTNLLEPGVHDLYVFGNLHPTLTLEAARARSDVLAARLNALDPGKDPRRLILNRPSRFNMGSAQPQDEGFLVLFASLTMGLAAAVLLVACLNLANMLLARGASRRKEIAIRMSLGGSRARVIRQLLIEGLLLAVAGGGAGLLLSVWSGDAVLNWAQAAFNSGPFAMTVHPAIDSSLLIASLAMSVVATLVFSLVPALRATRVNLVEDLKQQPGGPSSAESWSRFFSLRHSLAMAQLALSLMLLFCAGLFLRGSHTASERNPGFNTEGQLVANVDFSFGGLDHDEVTRRQNALLEEGKNVPGVSAAALASVVPYNFELRYFHVFPAGRAIVEDGKVKSGQRAGYTAVSHDYFSTLGIPLLQGRDFTDTESSQRGTRNTAIIDESLARVLFPDEEAVGRHIVLNPTEAVGHPDREIEIVGVVRSTQDDIFQTNAPFRLYRPLGQMNEPNTYLHLKISLPGAEAAVIEHVRRGFRDLDRSTPLLSVRPLADFLQKNINLLLVRMAASAFSVFGFVAVVLAVVGVYGLKAYAVAQRTREIGIRLALGAQAGDVVKLILRQGAAQVTVAAAAGVALALIAGQALSKMLYRVEPFDPLLLMLAALVTIGAALLACWFPARRATRVDPAIALRSE